MGRGTLKQTNISELPISGDISGEDYIIVQGKEVTTRVQFKDVYISKENTTFGQEINDLYEKLDGLTDIVNDMPTTAATYSKSEMDAKLDAKSNTSSSLTTPEIEGKYYSKEIIDGKLLVRPLRSDVYSKADVDNLVGGLNQTITSLQDTVQGLYSRIEYLENLHDRKTDEHFVPTISWNDLVDKPTGSSSGGTTLVGFSGNYNDLKNKPTDVTANSSGLMTPEQKSKLDAIDINNGKIPVSVQNFHTGGIFGGETKTGLTLDNIVFSGSKNDPVATYHMTHTTDQTKHHFLFKEWGASFRNS